MCVKEESAVQTYTNNIYVQCSLKLILLEIIHNYKKISLDRYSEKFQS